MDTSPKKRTNGQHAYKKTFNIMNLIFLVFKKKVLKRRKEQKKFNRYSREDFLKSNKAHEKMFNIISHQGNAIKTTNRYYHTSIRKDDDKEADHISVGRGVEKMKPSYLASGGNVIWHNHLQQSDSFL